MSQRRDLEERTEGDAPAQDSATWAEDSVLQADACSCALPCSLPIPQGCAAFLQLAREFPQAQEFTPSHCCCTGSGGSSAQAGAEQQLELGWAGSTGKSLPGRAGSRALAIPTLRAFSWESPLPGTACAAWVCWEQPTCAPPRVPGYHCSLPEPWHHVLLLPPADIPSWPGHCRFLCLWSISLPGSCYKRFLLFSNSEVLPFLL